VSSSIAAVLMALITSGSIVVRNYRLLPSGDLRSFRRGFIGAVIRFDPPLVAVLGQKNVSRVTTPGKRNQNCHALLSLFLAASYTCGSGEMVPVLVVITFLVSPRSLRWR
jgi:hypothetical protein